MVTPYDWQEGIGHRAQYIDARLAQGAPVLAVSLDEGILFLTHRRQSKKVYEVYDQLAMAALGQQSDIESLRVAAIDFAHQEGFNRSEQDVTIQRVVNALSGPIKKAFADFSSYPVVARALFAELGSSPALDSYYVLDYDGDYSQSTGSGVLVGESEQLEEYRVRLSAIEPGTGSADALEILRQMLASKAEGDEEAEVLREEAVLMVRDPDLQSRFRAL